MEDYSKWDQEHDLQDIHIIQSGKIRKQSYFLVLNKQAQPHQTKPLNIPWYPENTTTSLNWRKSATDFEE